MLGSWKIMRAIIVAGFVVAALATHISVMMPLDTITNNGDLKYDDNTMNSWFSQLASGNVDGVMLDCWWGLAEPSPQSYHFEPYVHIASLLKEHNLSLSLVASFHKCGGNVGDACDIPLPQWVLAPAKQNGLLITDQWGNTDDEYLPWSADNAPIFSGRTAVQCYRDYAKALIAAFKTAGLDSQLAELQVGLGPAGELRYPSYQLAHWNFPNIGAFQCWDKGELSNLKIQAAKYGHPEWTSPPTDAGDYNSQPSQTAFFTNGYKSDYGDFFLNWYSQQLLWHGENVLTAIGQVWPVNSIPIAAKVSGIHWLYRDPSHAAEVTAGYYNTNGNDGYMPIALLFKRMGAVFDFTCMEMLDRKQCNTCAPEELVEQVRAAVIKVGGVLAGENALPDYSDEALTQAAYQCRGGKTSTPLDTFTWLRLDNTFWSNYDNWKSKFVGPCRGN